MTPRLRETSVELEVPFHDIDGMGIVWHGHYFKYLEIARTKLVPGGVFIAETVNPHSPRALKAFWVDPTHQHPLFPETMLALCQLTGFEEAEIMFPLGSDDLETDLRTCGEYAVIAGAREVA